MKKPIVFYIIIVFLLLANSFLAINIRKKTTSNKELNYKIYKLGQKVEFLDLKNFALEQGILKNIESNNILINKYLEIDNAFNTIFLNDVGFENPKIILRYSELNCNACVDSQFSELNDLAKKIGEENIVIIGAYNRIDDLNRFKRVNNINFTIYNLNDLGIKLDIENIPYYFVMDNNFRVMDLFIPKKELPELTKAYFEQISQKYFGI